MKTLTMVAASVAAFALLAGPASAAGKCVMAGGTADMLTEDLARFMATAALNNQIKNNGWKASGPMKVVCKPGVPINCTARQRACK